MIVTKLRSVDGMEFTARSNALLTAEEIHDWERDIAWDTEELSALDESSGDRFRHVDGNWIKI